MCSEHLPAEDRPEKYQGQQAGCCVAWPTFQHLRNVPDRELSKRRSRDQVERILELGVYLPYFAKQLQAGGKYALTIWPYHAMLGGIGHALVSSVEEAIFFHSVVRLSQPDLSQPDVQVKGNNPLTENYSVLNPEVLEDAKGKTIAKKNSTFLKKLTEFDAVIIAGQAKSHCVAWTIEDLLKEICCVDEKLTEKIYLLEDCTSSVVIPGVIDYTADADAAFQRFAEAGMHVVSSAEPFEIGGGIEL